MSDVLTGLAKAHEINRLRRESGEKIVIKSPLERAALNPSSRRLAIAAKCYDCIGQDADIDWRGSIRGCPCVDCPLYPLRPYKQQSEK